MPIPAQAKLSIETVRGEAPKSNEEAIMMQMIAHLPAVLQSEIRQLAHQQGFIAGFQLREIMQRSGAPEMVGMSEKEGRARQGNTTTKE